MCSASDFNLPAKATVYYFNLFDDRDCVASSEHEELPSAAHPLLDASLAR